MRGLGLGIGPTMKQSKLAFAVSRLFRNGEQGAHFEAYDPNKLLRRQNLLTDSNKFNNWTVNSGLERGTTPTVWHRMARQRLLSLPQGRSTGPRPHVVVFKLCGPITPAR